MQSQLGISGCDVTLEKRDGKLFVRKTAKDADYVPRLHKQAYKQAFYASLYKGHPHIHVPRVLNIGDNCFDMEFIPAWSYIEFVEMASSSEVKRAISMVIQLLTDWKESCVAVSDAFTYVNESVKRSKPHVSLDVKYRGKKLLKYSMNVDMNMPVGANHGDFTMANIMFEDDGRLVLIDWSDREPGGYYSDIIRLRQEAFCNWTSINSGQPHDATKVAVVNSQLSREILRWFPEIVPSKCFGVLEAVNYLRILDYTDGMAEVTSVVTQAFNDSCERLGL